VTIQTTEELWRLVGEELLRLRHRHNWNLVDVQKHGGPNYETVEAVEKGRAGTIRALEQICHALGVSLIDVLRTVLASHTERLDPEVNFLVRRYVGATRSGQQFMEGVAELAPQKIPGSSSKAN
jgi:hypothetical protein